MKKTKEKRERRGEQGSIPTHGSSAWPVPPSLFLAALRSRDGGASGRLRWRPAKSSDVAIIFTVVFFKIPPPKFNFKSPFLLLATEPVGSECRSSDCHSTCHPTPILQRSSASASDRRPSRGHPSRTRGRRGGEGKASAAEPSTPNAERVSSSRTAGRPTPPTAGKGPMMTEHLRIFFN